MLNRLFILLIGTAFVGCGDSTDKLNGIWVSGDFNKSQAVIVIENGMWSEYVSGLPFRYEASLDGEELTLGGDNLFTEEYEEKVHKVRFTNDSLFIINEEMDDFLFIRKNSSDISEIIISSSNGKIELPKVEFCGGDGIDSEHNIFIDKQNSIDRTVVIDESEKKIEFLSSNEMRNPLHGNGLINLFIDENVPYSYVKEVQLQMRLSNNLRIRYVLDENECELNKDSTQLQLNYLRVNLPYFVGILDDSLDILLPPRPEAHEIKSENLFIVTLESADVFILNDEKLNRKSFLNKLDSIVLNVPKYVLVYGFNENALFKDYLDFKVTFQNQLNVLRNDYSYNEFGVSYEKLSATIGNDESIKENYKHVKKKVPQRLMTIEDYEINKKLYEDAK